MQILIIAATAAEIQPLTDHFKTPMSFDVLITGVGMVATAYAMGNYQLNKYDLLINLGIAGSFDRNMALGEVVEIVEDTLSELGAEDDETFIPIKEMGFGESDFNATARLSAFFKDHGLKAVNAITVNKVHGNESSIADITDRLKPQIEDRKSVV